MPNCTKCNAFINTTAPVYLCVMCRKPAIPENTMKDATHIHTPTGKKCRIMRVELPVGRSLCDFGTASQPFNWVQNADLRPIASIYRITLTSAQYQLLFDTLGDACSAANGWAATAKQSDSPSAKGQEVLATALSNLRNAVERAERAAT